MQSCSEKIHLKLFCEFKQTKQKLIYVYNVLNQTYLQQMKDQGLITQTNTFVNAGTGLLHYVRKAGIDFRSSKLLTTHRFVTLTLKCNDKKKSVNMYYVFVRFTCLFNIIW